MKIRLVFDDWRDKKHQSVYSTQDGIDLSMGDFHAGTTFEAEISLNAEQEAELRDALREGYVPVFYVRLSKEYTQSHQTRVITG